MRPLLPLVGSRRKQEKEKEDSSISVRKAQTRLHLHSVSKNVSEWLRVL